MSNSAPVVQSVHKSFPLPLGTSVYIRVLKIRPSAVTDSSDRIECDFSILDVDNGSLYDLDTASPLSATTPYTALSYTWGDTIADHDINLNGTPFLVRQNLWNFLDRARNDNFEGYLWIDALCIDQTEVGERNHQVALMGEIYSHAEGVIVWLGHVDGYIEDAMGALGRVVSPVRLPSDLVAQHLHGMQRFCELGYWSRAWIVQEYILARRVEVWSSNIKLRGRTVGWLHSEGFLKYVNRAARMEQDSPAIRIVLYRRECLQRLASGHTMLGQVPAHHEFLRLIKKFEANMACADARDRVYALLSLIGTEGRKKLSINPDYTKSTAELFTSVVYSFAKQLLSPETLEKVFTVPYATDSDSEIFKRIMDYIWVHKQNGKRTNLISLIRTLYHMLSLSEDDVAVQNIWRAVNIDASAATVSTIPETLVKSITQVMPVWNFQR